VLLPRHVGWDVVGTESATELSPWHLVVHDASGSVVGPPPAGITTQLLHGEESLLVTPRVSNPHDYINHMLKRP
jgi:hypothetical protein